MPVAPERHFEIVSKVLLRHSSLSTIQIYWGKISDTEALRWLDNLLLSPDLRTGAGQLFLEQYGYSINLSLSGQYAMKKIFEAHLKRVEYDPQNLPMKFYPFIKQDIIESKKSIVINPFISFIKQVLANRNISTYVIVNRIDAGENIKDVADDYNLEVQDVEDAILYERAA